MTQKTGKMVTNNITNANGNLSINTENLIKKEKLIRLSIIIIYSGFVNLCIKWILENY